jgi:hypothetical protein
MILILLAMSLVHLALGCALNAALPHLGMGYHGTLEATALTGALWVGALGTGIMGIAAGLVEGLLLIKQRRHNGGLWTD